MYLKPVPSYYRGTEQHAGRGPYLALFSWNDYRAADEVREVCPECQRLRKMRDQAIDRWNDDPIGNRADHDAFNWPAACTAHSGITLADHRTPRYANGRPKVWAIVRSVALHQFGHFMMGGFTIGGRRISVSGSIGHDGLPLDLQAVPPAFRDRLVEVPEAIAESYWTDNGHNTIGADAREVLRAWALETFQIR